MAIDYKASYKGIPAYSTIARRTRAYNLATGNSYSPAQVRKALIFAKERNRPAALYVQAIAKAPLKSKDLSEFAGTVNEAVWREFARNNAAAEAVLYAGDKGFEKGGFIYIQQPNGSYARYNVSGAPSGGGTYTRVKNLPQGASPLTPRTQDKFLRNKAKYIKTHRDPQHPAEGYEEW